MSKTLPLTDGHRFAIVDDEDFERLSKYKWEYHGSNGNTYASRRKQVNGVRKTFMLHREVMGCVEGDGKIIDHISGDAFDNRKCNLRIADCAQNHWNAKRSVKNTSGVRGVYFSKAKKKWKCWIMVRGVRTHLGSFENYDEAVAVRRKAEHQNYGEFARLPDHVRKEFDLCPNQK